MPVFMDKKTQTKVYPIGSISLQLIVPLITGLPEVKAASPMLVRSVQDRSAHTIRQSL